MRYAILFMFLFSYVFGQEIALSEKFETDLPNDWKVESSNKKRSWRHKVYKDLSYMNMSAYGGKGKSGYRVKTKLHSPEIKPIGNNCKLRFVFADAYQNGQPLQVLLSDKNFRPIQSLSDTFWKTLVNNADRYDNVYENTEWIPLPQIEKPYRISFVYDSEVNDYIVTTTIQLKEVDVWCE